MFSFKRIFKFFKFFAVFVTSCGCIFLVGGCVPKQEWVLKCGNSVVTSGEYVSLMVSNLMEANKQLSKHNDSNFNFKVLQNGNVGAKPAFEWVEQETKKSAEQLVLLKNEYEKKGLDNKKENRHFLRQHVERDYDYDFAEAQYRLGAKEIGLDKQAFLDGAVNDGKSYSVFVSEFGVGNKRHIDDERFDEFTRQNFIKFKIVRILKNIESPEYCEVNDSKPGSKLEKKAGVKTPKELVDKYMNEIKEGRTIDDINNEHNEFLGVAKTEPKFNVVYKFTTEKYPDEIFSAELKALISEVEPKAGPVLKENEKHYFIIQRFDLDDEDVKNDKGKSESILLDQEGSKYIDELKSQNKIEVNEKVLRKYRADKQAELIAKNKPKRSQGANGGFGNLF